MRFSKRSKVPTLATLTRSTEFITTRRPPSRRSSSFRRFVLPKLELCEMAPGSSHFQLAYYVDNPWPARVFGGFAVEWILAAR